MLVALERLLLNRGVLNTKDLPPIVGQDPGTFRDYLLNMWHWDGAIGLLFVLSLPCLFVGIQLLVKASPKPAVPAQAS